MLERDGLFTAKQAAAYLGISLSTLHKIEQQGTIVPYRTPGGHRRYDTHMLEEYLEASRRSPHQRPASKGQGLPASPGSNSFREKQP